MKLEKSLHSDGGLPLNPIANLGTPEEQLAARLIQRLAVSPPIDVHKIASSLASVTEKAFPIEIDGLCLDLKALGKRPKIWVSKSLGRVRRRFTLAHEIGHILIPWHMGSIVDDLEAPHSGARGAYRQMEAEANRFAAELLMPAAWVSELSNRAEHIVDLMHTIVRVADVSYPAGLFRVQKFGPPGYVGAEVRDEFVVWSGRTKGTWSRPPAVGMHIGEVDMPVADEPRVLSADRSEYFWWRMREEVDAPSEPAAPWRESLEEVLLAIPAQERVRTRARLNAIIGFAIGKEPKGSSVRKIYRRGLEASQNRSDRDPWVAAAISHPSFRKYVLGRAHERARG